MIFYVFDRKIIFDQLFEPTRLPPRCQKQVHMGGFHQCAPVLAPGWEARRLKKLVKNNFSIENIKNHDFGALEMSYSPTKSNIKSIRCVLAGDKKYKNGLTLFWGSQKWLEKSSITSFEHKTNGFGRNLDNGHLIFLKSA